MIRCHGQSPSGAVSSFPRNLASGVRLPGVWFAVWVAVFCLVSSVTTQIVLPPEQTNFGYSYQLVTSPSALNATRRAGVGLWPPPAQSMAALIAPAANSAAATLASYHSVDTNRDGRILLTELTRVIELSNTRTGTVRTGQYHPQGSTEDGFAPGP